MIVGVFDQNVAQVSLWCVDDPFGWWNAVLYPTDPSLPYKRTVTYGGMRYFGAFPIHVDIGGITLGYDRCGLAPGGKGLCE